MKKILVLFKLDTGIYSPSWLETLPGVPFSGQTYLIGNFAYKVVQTTDYYGFPPDTAGTAPLDYPGITEDRETMLKSIADATKSGERPSRVVLVETRKDDFYTVERFPLMFV